MQGTNISTYTEIDLERLHTLEFTSDRKRMSVIVRDPHGQIWLYMKGAESHVLPLCRSSSQSEQNLIKVTQTQIDDFAKIGLRTLAIARRKMTNDEYTKFSIGMDVFFPSNLRIFRLIYYPEYFIYLRHCKCC